MQLAKTREWLEVLELRLEGKSYGGEFSLFIASRLLCQIVALIVTFRASGCATSAV